MKKLLLITILIGGCATTPPRYEISAQERQEICKLENLGKYWGDCHVNSFKNDPNYEKVQAHLKKFYPTIYSQNRTLRIVNTGLLRQLNAGTITDEEANKQFTDRLNLYRKNATVEYEQVAKRQEEERKKNALAWQQLGQALSESNAMLNQNNPNYNQNNTAPKNSGYLKDEYVSGFNKVCIYEGISGTFTINISSAGICPLNAQQ